VSDAPTANARVTLREVTRENLREVLLLEVAPEQKGFVASNAISIAQAHFYPEVAWFRAIYANDTPVGFLMLEDSPGAPEVFLWRFMIDRRFQNHGFGGRAIELVLEHVRAREGTSALTLSHVPGEGSPGPFYQRLGFVYTGEKDPDGELLMRMEL
jgi:diamine N-acetyltransferase